MAWRRLNGEKLTKDITEEVEEIIVREKALGYNLRVCIGTDSQQYGPETEFATVIVFVREGAGAFMLIDSFRTKDNYSLKERMMLEVSKSIEIAYTLCEIFVEHNVGMEVHADINTNPNFGSSVALRDAMGYILGMGYTFKAKPDAFASSCCADKVIS